MTAKRVAAFCACGAPRDKPGQALCKACHRTYMQRWRRTHVSVPVELLRQAAGSLGTGADPEGWLREQLEKVLERAGVLV